MSENHREAIVKVICDTMKENMEFLEKRSEWIIKEAIELINDCPSPHACFVKLFSHPKGF